MSNSALFFLLLTVLVANQSGLVHASTGKALDFTIHQEYISTRAMGMGNAFTAVANDHSAIFYNPAALARREEGHVRLFLRGAIDSEYMGFLDDIENTESDQLAELIESQYGSHYHSRVPTLGGFWVRPNWGMAFIPADLSIDVGLHQQVGPMANINAYLDSTFAYAYAQDENWLGESHHLSWGVTAKAIHRVYVGEAISAATLAGDADFFDTNMAREGMTLDFDLGTLYTPPISTTGHLSFLQYMRPTFAVVIRNVLDYGFPMNFNFIDDDSGKPPELQRRLDLGSSYELPQLWVFDTRVALDMRDIGHENWSLKKGFHMGAEFYWTMFNWWKGHWSLGLNQGYLSAGFGARLGWFQLDFATWGEEVGTNSVPNENRRYMVELSLDF